MQPVVTVHGISTEGRWQEEIAPVLYPHFEPASVKYRSYRFLGPLDLVFEPWVLLPGLALWGAAWPFLWWREWLQLKTGVRLSLLLVAILVAAHLFVYIRLRKTVQKFLDESVPAILKGHIHIIAHSLGSYIVCTALQDDPTMSAQRIVLAGCVVNTGFAWKNLNKKVVAVRNEVAGRDLVPLAAKCLRWRFCDFGSAGRNGFQEDGSVPNLVQNVLNARKGHSGVLKATYVKYFWLPFFWGIDPGEFREFLDDCFAMMGALAAAGSPNVAPPSGEFDLLAEAFLKRQWGWAGGRTIPGYLTSIWRVVLNPADEKIIAFTVCLAVTSAEDALHAKVKKWKEDRHARQSYKSADYDDAIKALNPVTAVARAFATYNGP
jgi:hypothetical protein